MSSFSFARPLLLAALLVAGDALAQAPAPDAPAAEDVKPDDARPNRRGHRDERVSVGGSVEVRAGESVKEAVAVGGSTTVFGHVRGDAVAIGGTVSVKKGAHVEGDAVAIGGAVDVEDGATVDGDRVSIGSFLGPAGLVGAVGTLGAFAVLWSIVSALFQVFGLLAIGALFVAFMPRRIDRMKKVLVERPLPSAGVGLLAFLGVVPATILLVITILGIVLVPFLWMFAGLLVALGLTLVAQLVGERLPLKPAWRGPFVTLALGALVLALVRLVPFLGGAVSVAAMLVGVGAVLLTRFGTEPPPAERPLPSDPGGLEAPDLPVPPASEG